MTPMIDEAEEALYEGERYAWSCPDCGAMHYEEFDPRGESVRCEGCFRTWVVAR